MQHRWTIQRTEKPIAQAQVRAWAKVPSMSDGRKRYLVTKHRLATQAKPEYRCDCPAFRFRPVMECKHIVSFKKKEQGR